MVVVLDRLFVPSEFGLGMAAAEIGRGIIRVKADCPVVVGDGFRIAIKPGKGPGPLEIEPGSVRVEADRLGAIGNRFLEPVQFGVITTGAGPDCRAAAVVGRKGVAEDLQPWRSRGGSSETPVGAYRRAGFGFQRCGDEKGSRLDSFAGRLSNPSGSGGQARRNENIAASCRRSDTRFGRDGAEPSVEPKPAGRDHDAQNYKNRSVGFQLPADPLLALVQQVAAELVDLPLQLDVAGVGRKGFPTAPGGCLL